MLLDKIHFVFAFEHVLILIVQYSLDKLLIKYPHVLDIDIVTNFCTIYGI